MQEGTSGERFVTHFPKLCLIAVALQVRAAINRFCSAFVIVERSFATHRNRLTFWSKLRLCSECGHSCVRGVASPSALVAAVKTVALEVQHREPWG